MRFQPLKPLFHFRQFPPGRLAEPREQLPDVPVRRERRGPERGQARRQKAGRGNHAEDRRDQRAGRGLKHAQHRDARPRRGGKRRDLHGRRLSAAPEGIEPLHHAGQFLHGAPPDFLKRPREEDLRGAQRRVQQRQVALQVIEHFRRGLHRRPARVVNRSGEIPEGLLGSPCDREHGVHARRSAQQVRVLRLFLLGEPRKGRPQIHHDIPQAPRLPLRVIQGNPEALHGALRLFVGRHAVEERSQPRACLLRLDARVRHEAGGQRQVLHGKAERAGHGGHILEGRSELHEVGIAPGRGRGQDVREASGLSRAFAEGGQGVRDNARGLLQIPCARDF